MTQRKQVRTTATPQPTPYVDPETYRLSELQLEHLGLVGIQVTAAGRASLAAAARTRLAEHDGA